MAPVFKTSNRISTELQQRVIIYRFHSRNLKIIIKFHRDTFSLKHTKSQIHYENFSFVLFLPQSLQKINIYQQYELQHQERACANKHYTFFQVLFP